MTELPAELTRATTKVARHEKGLALIEDTPEIRAKLREIAEALNLLRTRLSELVNSKDLARRLLKMHFGPPQLTLEK